MSMLDSVDLEPGAPWALTELLRHVPAEGAGTGHGSTVQDAVRTSGRTVAVLDDDPTGTQTVHDVPVVTSWTVADLQWAMNQDSVVFYVLTNSRSLSESAAVAVNIEVAANLTEAARLTGRELTVLSRSDSTLRGHVRAETETLMAAASAAGAPYDGLVFCPAYLEAGRVTALDVHWMRVGDDVVPVGISEFARDATFGYHASNLRYFLAEKGVHGDPVEEVRTLTLEDIRLGGPDVVASRLASLSNGVSIVVNALTYDDLNVVVLGLLAAEADGMRFLYRTGPSFVQARAGLTAKAPLSHAEVFPDGPRTGHGLVVVGSHVALTGRQVERAQHLTGLAQVELDVVAVLDPARRDAEVARVVAALVGGLAGDDVLLQTSRLLVTAADGEASLALSRQVSEAVTDVVRQVRDSVPLAWVVAKGGITSSDVATRGLGVRRATVVGQLLPGVISVWRLDESGSDLNGMPYVVFAGNVGDDESLVHVVRVLRGEL